MTHEPEVHSRPKPQSAGVMMHRVSTPFDRKRTQEVVKLNKKVESNLAQQLEQTNHLMAFKKNIVEQEMEIAVQTLTCVSVMCCNVILLLVTE